MMSLSDQTCQRMGLGHFFIGCNLGLALRGGVPRGSRVSSVAAVKVKFYNLDVSFIFRLFSNRIVIMPENLTDRNKCHKCHKTGKRKKDKLHKGRRQNRKTAKSVTSCKKVGGG